MDGLYSGNVRASLVATINSAGTFRNLENAEVSFVWAGLFCLELCSITSLLLISEEILGLAALMLAGSRLVCVGVFWGFFAPSHNAQEHVEMGQGTRFRCRDLCARV